MARLADATERSAEAATELQLIIREDCPGGELLIDQMGEASRELAATADAMVDAVPGQGTAVQAAQAQPSIVAINRLDQKMPSV